MDNNYQQGVLGHKFKTISICKKIKEKMNKGNDIFARNPESFKYLNYIQKSNIINLKYYNSDVFHIKNNRLNVKKIGEKYLLNTIRKPKYTSSRESNSYWENNLVKLSMNNCSSKKYNILAPNI